MRDVFLQFFHPLQGCVLGFGVFQQGSHIKHVIQVSLYLNLQLVALRVFQLLKIKVRCGVSLSMEIKHDYPTAYMFV